MSRQLRLLGGVAAAVALTEVGEGIVRRYRRDLAGAADRLAAVDRRLFDTRFGPQEYAVAGQGAPLLVSHGIFHGCDGGLWSVRDIVADRQVIAPSRFGYLGSSMPKGATPADQADAYASLLDHLGVSRSDLIGISAGTSSALQLAMRHPERVRHLVVLSGNLPGNPTAKAPPGWARVLYRDPVMWALSTYMPGLFQRMMGVPAGFPHDLEERRVISELTDGIFPIAARAAGALFDAFVSNPDVNGYELESVHVPTLLIHAQDDPLTSYEAARRAAERIPGAAFLSLESGGHLQFGQSDRIRNELATFLSLPVAA